MIEFHINVRGALVTPGFIIEAAATCEGVNCAEVVPATWFATFALTSASDDDTRGMTLLCDACAELMALDDDTADLTSLDAARAAATPTDTSNIGTRGPSPKVEERNERLIEYLREKPATSEVIANRFSTSTGVVASWMRDLIAEERVERRRVKFSQNQYTYHAI